MINHTGGCSVKNLVVTNDRCSEYLMPNRASVWTNYRTNRPSLYKTTSDTYLFINYIVSPVYFCNYTKICYRCIIQFCTYTCKLIFASNNDWFHYDVSKTWCYDVSKSFLARSLHRDTKVTFRVASYPSFGCTLVMNQRVIQDFFFYLHKFKDQAAGLMDLFLKIPSIPSSPLL